MTWLWSFPYLSLRYLLLGVLGGFAVLISSGTYITTKPLILHYIEAHFSREMQADVLHLQGVLLLLLRSGNLDSVRSVVATMSDRHEHELTIVTDASGRILASTRLEMLETLWTAHSAEVEPALLAELAAMGSRGVRLAADGVRLSGYAQFCIEGEASTPLSAACGFLYTRSHIGFQKATAVKALRAQAIYHGGGVCMAALVLWGLVHLTVTRRVERLIAVVRRFTAGDWSARTGFTGHDEVAHVGKAFDTMAQSMAEGQQEVLRQQQRLTTLVQVAQRLTRGLTLPTVLHAIADAAAQVFGGEAAFHLLEQSWLGPFEATPGACEAITREPLALEKSLSSRVVASGTAGMSTHIATDARMLPEHRHATQPELTGTLMCVPVSLEDRVLGTLHISREQGYPFTQEELSLAASLAHQAAIAIENAQLFEALQVRTASLAQTNASLEEHIRERQRVEASLREREVRMRTIVETAVEAILTIDEQGIVETYNAAAERLFGYTAAEVIGRNVCMLMPSPYHEEHDSYLSHYLRTGERRIIGIGREVVGLRKDGTAFPMTLAVSEMYVGEHRLFTGMVSDITARKQAEDALRQANEVLEQRVQERTAALEEANEEIKRFAYIVSHDLRAPLVNLKGFAGELRLAQSILVTAMEQSFPHLPPSQAAEVRHTLTQDIPEALDFIEASATRMDSLVRAVLQLSRLGRQELLIEPLDMAALVQETLQTLGHQLAQHQVQVTVGSLPQVYADRTAMGQILANLLTNAITYLEPGRPGEIAITAEQCPQVMAFHIRDNGRGIAEGDIPRVFEPFRRVGRQDVPGEGMGLAYVRTLVRRHGGELTCESNLGVGSTFTFTIGHHLIGDTLHV